MSKPTKEEASLAWDTFNRGVKMLDDVCTRDGITLKLNVPQLGLTKKKKAALAQSAGDQSK